MTSKRVNGTKKANRSKGPKTASKSPNRPALIPQPNGRGALLAGGLIGNKGGGRPRDAIRAAAVEALQQGPGVLERIMKGETIVTITEECPECGYKPASGSLGVPVTVKPGEQVRAVEALDKLAGEEHATLYAMLFHRIRELTLELGGEKGPILLAAFHEAHRTLTEGK